MISAGFDDYKRNPLYRTEQILNKEEEDATSVGKTTEEQQKEKGKKENTDYGK